MNWYTLKEFIVNIIGPYTPVGTTGGIADVDFTFIFAGLLFLLFFRTFFKFIHDIFD